MGQYTIRVHTENGETTLAGVDGTVPDGDHELTGTYEDPEGEAEPRVSRLQALVRDVKGALHVGVDSGEKEAAVAAEDELAKVASGDPVVQTSYGPGFSDTSDNLSAARAQAASDAEPGDGTAARVMSDQGAVAAGQAAGGLGEADVVPVISDQSPEVPPVAQPVELPETAQAQDGIAVQQEDAAGQQVVSPNVDPAEPVAEPAPVATDAEGNAYQVTDQRVAEPIETPEPAGPQPESPPPGM